MPIPVANSQVAVVIPKNNQFLKSGSFFVPTSSIHTITAISTGSITFTPALSNYTTISSASLTWLDSSSLSSPFYLTTSSLNIPYDVIDNLIFSNLFSFGSSTTIVTQSNSSFIFNSSSIVGASTRQFSIGYLSSSIQEYYDYTVTEAVVSLVIDDSDGSIQFQDGFSTATGITINSDTAVKGGINNRATGTGSFAVGSGSSAEGNASFTAGKSTTATGEGSFAIGSSSLAQGNTSIAEGIGTLASGVASHAAGINTTASGQAAFSIGIETDADGVASFAAGSGSWARGDSSVAMGIGTIASASAQVTIGHYNFPLNSPDHLFVVGGGTGTSTANRGNLLEVYGGIGSTYKAVKIDVGNTFTQTSAPPAGFNVYGNSTFRGNITASLGSSIILNDDSLNLNATSSFIILDTDTITGPSPDFNKLVINRFGINFQTSDKSTSPGTRYLWTDATNRLFYGSGAIILNGGNTLGGAMTIGTNDTNNLQLETGGTTRVFISSSGNVGIGTSNPTYQLHVSASGGTNGTIYTSNRVIAAGGTAADPTFATNSTIAGLFEPSYANLGFTSYGGEAGRIETSNRYWNIGMTGGTAKMNIRGTGATSATTALRVENSNASASLVVLDNNFVGINTASAQYNLDVNGTLRSTGQTSLGGSGGTGGSGTWGIFVANNGNTFHNSYIHCQSVQMALFANPQSSAQGGYPAQSVGLSSANPLVMMTNSSERMRITSAGNIGIGIASPSASLHISGASNSGLLEIDSPAVNNIIYVSGSGNIGIGTGTPSARLHINGDTILSGSLYTYGANSDIDSGSLRTVLSVSTGSYRAAFFDYVLNKSTNARAGTVFSVWNGTSVEYTETSTTDIGNTSDVNLSVNLSGANIILYASSSTNDWSMKALARLL